SAATSRACSMPGRRAEANGKGWDLTPQGSDPNRAVVEQELLNALVPVLPRGVDRPEAATLLEVRVGPVLERDFDELVPGLFAFALSRCRGVDHRGLDVLVPRQLVHVGAALQQQPHRVEVPEEGCQPDGVEAIVAVLVHE